MDTSKTRPFKSLIREVGVQQLPLTEIALRKRQWSTGTIEARQTDMATTAAALWPE